MVLIILALALLAIGFFLADYGNTTAVAIQTIGMFLFLYSLPKYANSIAIKKYPGFGSLVKGDVPYNEISSLPMRIVVVGAYAFFLVALGLAGVVGVYFAIETIK